MGSPSWGMPTLFPNLLTYTRGGTHRGTVWASQLGKPTIRPRGTNVRFVGAARAPIAHVGPSWVPPLVLLGIGLPVYGL